MNPWKPRLSLLYLLTVTLLLLAYGCADRAPRTAKVKESVPPTDRIPAKSPATVLDPKLRFRSVAKEAGLNYRWQITGKRPLSILQTIGNGCAFIDYDNDRNLDILLVGTKMALFKGDGAGRFTDVSSQSGIGALRGHFLGCAAGDFDNDGFEDLYVSGYRTGVLLHNEAGASFKDVTGSAGIRAQPWGSSCGFADLDGDGFLDLYVANYVEFDPEVDLVLCPFKGVLSGCGPVNYEAAYGVLYRNLGNGKFRDDTKAAGIKATGKGLGVAFAKYQSNGRLSFAVANDLMPGDLFSGLGQGRFRNSGIDAGVAFDETGENHAGMGIDWADYDNDGGMDLFVTTFSNETKTLYRNDGHGAFTIVSEETQVDVPTRPYVGWGCKFFDADNDGWVDLLVANGHVQDNIDRFEKLSYREPIVFLHNQGGPTVTFQDSTKPSGVARVGNIVGRGLVVGDYDNDGLVDALVVDSEGSPILLHNESQLNMGWVGFDLRNSRRGNRDGYGAVIRVVTNGQKRYKQCHPGGSYLSSSDPRVHFGLGDGRPDIVTIAWHDGRVESWTNLEPGKYYTVDDLEKLRGQPAP